LTGLYRILIYSGFSLDRFIQDSDLFRVQFKTELYRILIYSGFSLDRILVYSGFSLYRILSYSGFSLDRFIQDSELFRVQLRQVYTEF
jgi:hypothetical protein